MVKTVNMKSPGTRQFNQFDNIGWYDIELDFLKVVPKPEPKPAEEKDSAKEGGRETSSGPEGGCEAGRDGCKAKHGRYLSCGASEKGTGEPVTAPAAKAATAAKPAAAKPAGAASMADILAVCRGKGAAPAAPAAKPAKPEPEPVTGEVAVEPVAEAAPVVEPAEP